MIAKWISIQQPNLALGETIRIGIDALRIAAIRLNREKKWLLPQHTKVENLSNAAERKQLHTRHLYLWRTYQFNLSEWIYLSAVPYPARFPVPLNSE